MITPQTATSITLLSRYPSGWSIPELSGYLLRECVVDVEPMGNFSTRTLLQLIEHSTQS